MDIRWIAFDVVRSPKVIWAVIKARVGRIGYGPRERAKELQQLSAQFAALGLDFSAAKNRVDELVKAHSLSRSDNSLHYELFAGISQVCNPQRILEVGTFRGEFTAFLATLFPDAYIETWDLPQENDGEMKSYIDDFEAHYRDQTANRAKNIGGRSNVNQVLRDSTGLFAASDAFDLIWVDGDHTFPVVAFDLINALRLSGPQSWIAVDDIKLVEMRKSVLSSTEAIRSIQHLVRSGHVTSHLIYKRVGASGRRWRDDNRRKHLAILKRA
jgi:predicted O-methyltransferase YrrM